VKLRILDRELIEDSERPSNLNENGPGIGMLGSTGEGGHNWSSPGGGGGFRTSSNSGNGTVFTMKPPSIGSNLS